MKPREVRLAECADAATRDKSPATTPPTPNRCAAGESDLRGIRIDMDCQRAYIGKTPIRLTETEFRVFAVLAAAPNQSLLPQHLFEYVWVYTGLPKSANPMGLVSQYQCILNKRLSQWRNVRIVRDKNLICLQCQRRPKFTLSLKGQCLLDLRACLKTLFDRLFSQDEAYAPSD
jgi:hypothetical protein